MCTDIYVEINYSLKKKMKIIHLKYMDHKCNHLDYQQENHKHSFINFHFDILIEYLLCTFNSNLELIRRRQWHPTPVLLPGKSHGWRSLVGCSPWGH